MPTLVRKIQASLQRGKILEDRTVFGEYYLIALDGTGYHCSHKVKCEKCCIKNHSIGSKDYYHLMITVAMIHPEQREVSPLAPEPILKDDGTTKNDCERNAAKRVVDDLKREHPRLKAIIVEDALASNGPQINHLKSKGFQQAFSVPNPVITSACSVRSKSAKPGNRGRCGTKRPAPYNVLNGTSDCRSTTRIPT